MYLYTESPYDYDSLTSSQPMTTPPHRVTLGKNDLWGSDASLLALYNSQVVSAVTAGGTIVLAAGDESANVAVTTAFSGTTETNGKSFE